MTNILVVDDDSGIRKLLRYVLESDGYDVCEAINGKAACKVVSENIPDLVLLDMEMPVMDGFGVMEVLRNNPDTFDLPVVMLTSRAAADCEQEALDYGVAHYISKPWQTDLLRAAVRTALRMPRNQKERPD